MSTSNNNARTQRFLSLESPTFFAHLGAVPSIVVTEKFGRHPGFDVVDIPVSIWEGGGLYPFQDGSDFQVEALSDSAADDLAGTGARTITVQGLAGAGWDASEEDIDLDGLTARTGTRTDWKRISRAFVKTAGSGEVNAGDLIVRLASAGAEQAHVGAGEGQSTQCVYTTAGGHAAVIRHITADLGDTQQPTTEMGVDVFTREAGVADSSWRLRTHITLRGSGTSSRTSQQEIYIGEKTDVDVRVTSSDTNNARISATFQAIEVDLNTATFF